MRITIEGKKNGVILQLTAATVGKNGKKKRGVKKVFRIATEGCFGGVIVPSCCNLR